MNIQAGGSNYVPAMDAAAAPRNAYAPEAAAAPAPAAAPAWAKPVTNELALGGGNRPSGLGLPGLPGHRAPGTAPIGVPVAPASAYPGGVAPTAPIGGGAGAEGSLDFEGRDGNGDGVLSGTELAGLNPAQLAAWDADKTGEISRNEAIVGQEVDQLMAKDGNGDGYLSGSELPTYLQKYAQKAADGRLVVGREQLQKALLAERGVGQVPGAGPQPTPGNGPTPQPYTPGAGGGSEGTAPISADDAARIRETYRKNGSRNGQTAERSLDLLDANGFTQDKMNQFKGLVEQNAQAEAAMVARLTPEQQAAYGRVKASIAHDAPAQLALSGMLAEGKLTARDVAGTGDLLSHLDAMAANPVANGIDRNKLVADTIQEVYEPSCINQHNRGTCAAATTQIKLAADKPAEYARLIAGLASPEGKVTLANGTTLEREAGTERADNTPRTQSSRLMQPAFMEYGEEGCNYDNRTDRHYGRRSFSGLTQTGVDRIMEGVWGQKVSTYERLGHSGEGMEKFKAALAAGQTVPIGVAWGSGMHARHEILATKIENGMLYYTNPWGLQGKMSMNDFVRRAPSASIAEWR